MKKTRKAAALILAVAIIAASFAACAKSGETTAAETPADTTAAAAAPSASDTGTVGYLTDKFDHFSRKPFKIAYICNYLTWAWNAAISDSLSKLGKSLNFEYAVFSANGNFDDYINQIEVLANTGTQGFILGIDDALASRTYEICRELNVAFIAESTPYRDEQGLNYWISVQQDQYNNGANCVQWLADNYKAYWGDIDISKLGLLVLNFSVVSGINEREPGCRELFVKLFPDAAANYYVGDLVTIENGFSADGGNKMAAAMLTAHPEVEHWFVVGLVDDWASGATRAVEGLNMEDKVLVTSVQADAFMTEMNSGYQGDVYVAACAVSSSEFAANMAAGLVAILEGRATPETLWPEWLEGGSKYASMKIRGTMITKDTYQQFLDTHSVDFLVSTAKAG